MPPITASTRGCLPTVLVMSWSSTPEPSLCCPSVELETRGSTENPGPRLLLSVVMGLEVQALAGLAELPSGVTVTSWQDQTGASDSLSCNVLASHSRSRQGFLDLAWYSLASVWGKTLVQVTVLLLSVPAVVRLSFAAQPSAW